MNNEKTVKIISIIGALVQIVGGILAIIAIVKISADPDYNLLVSVGISTPFLLLNFAACISLIVTKSPKGALLLLFHFLLQIVQFKFNGLYYFYSLGPFLGLGFVKKAGQEFSFWLESSEFIFTLLLRFVDDKVGVFFTINIVAIFFFTVLILEYNDRKSHTENN